MASPKEVGGLAHLALSTMHGDSEEGEHPQGEDEGLVSAMQDFLGAMSAKDHNGMASAFRSAHEICGGADGYDVPEMDE